MERGKDIVSRFPVQVAKEEFELVPDKCPGVFRLDFARAHRLFVDGAQVVDGEEPDPVDRPGSFLYVPGLGDVDENKRTGVAFDRPAPVLHGPGQVVAVDDRMGCGGAGDHWYPAGPRSEKLAKHYFYYFTASRHRIPHR